MYIIVLLWLHLSFSLFHYGFHSFSVVDWFCLFIYLWVLTFPLEDCSEFGNFVITLIALFVCLLFVWFFSCINLQRMNWKKNVQATFDKKNILIRSIIRLPLVYLQTFLLAAEPLFFMVYLTVKWIFKSHGCAANICMFCNILSDSNSAKICEK